MSRPGPLKAFAKSLREIPRVLALKVARKAAPDLTDRTRSAFDAGQTVFGDARPTGVDDRLMNLHKTGRLESALRFKPIGTIVRAVLAVPYAKYNIRYGILPHVKLPVAWRDALKAIVTETMRDAL